MQSSAMKHFPVHWKAFHNNLASVHQLLVALPLNEKCQSVCHHTLPKSSYSQNSTLAKSIGLMYLLFQYHTILWFTLLYPSLNHKMSPYSSDPLNHSYVGTLFCNQVLGNNFCFLLFGLSFCCCCSGRKYIIDQSSIKTSMQFELGKEVNHMADQQPHSREETFREEWKSQYY